MPNAATDKLNETAKTLAARLERNEITGEAVVREMGPLKSKTKRVVFNALLDAAVTAFFLALVIGIVLISLREWLLLLARKKAAEPRETSPTWLPDYALAEGKPWKLFSLLTLAFALAKELSGEAAVDRAARHAEFCAETPRRVDLLGGETAMKRELRQRAYVQAAEERFNGPNSCC